MKRWQNILTVVLTAVVLVGMSGCAGYANRWPYPEQIHTVYVEMFDTSDFRRGYEYQLTDAICKYLEAQTPYKIVSDRNRADSILSGTLQTGQGVLSMDRYTGKPLEQEAILRVTFTWKDLRTGQVLINQETVAAAEPYSAFLSQDFEYSAARAVNKAAQRLVERMESAW
ncbi:MAG TPA: LPS assembly lipoprotein LptE [Anaerohalosphaeraceae bacterium]|nr:LPS assembly lipoprotein LptE [Anaerohalosphaeraceae bacterium]HPB92573.1 LPS assembly lipoprotein LptE [Anaerohalosphaeraceae bacterium]